MSEKTYLETTAVLRRRGGLTPTSFIWEDQTIQIKRVLDVRCIQMYTKNIDFD